MSTPIADMVEKMLSTGIPPETIVLAVRTVELATTSCDPVAERRRAFDRERKQRKAKSGIPPESEKGGSLPYLLPSSLEVLKKEETECAREADDWPADYRERFWTTYPNKVGKPKALVKLDRARKRGVPWAELWGGLLRYVEKTDDRPWCNPETWINQDRWTDEPATVQNQQQRGPSNGNGIVQAGRRRLAQLAEIARRTGPDGNGPSEGGLGDGQGYPNVRLLSSR